MISIPEPQGTHKIFESDEEQESLTLGNLTVKEQAMQHSDGGQLVDQQAISRWRSEKDGAVMEAIAEDVAQHTVVASSNQSLEGNWDTQL